LSFRRKKNKAKQQSKGDLSSDKSVETVGSPPPSPTRAPDSPRRSLCVKSVNHDTVMIDPETDPFLQKFSRKSRIVTVGPEGEVAAVPEGIAKKNEDVETPEEEVRKAVPDGGARVAPVALVAPVETQEVREDVEKTEDVDGAEAEEREEAEDTDDDVEEQQETETETAETVIPPPPPPQEPEKTEDEEDLKSTKVAALAQGYVAVGQQNQALNEKHKVKNSTARNLPSPKADKKVVHSPAVVPPKAATGATAEIDSSPRTRVMMMKKEFSMAARQHKKHQADQNVKNSTAARFQKKKATTSAVAAFNDTIQEE